MNRSIYGKGEQYTDRRLVMIASDSPDSVTNQGGSGPYLQVASMGQVGEYAIGIC